MPQHDKELLDVPKFRQQLADNSKPVPLYRQALQHAKAILAERFYAGRSATELVHSHAAVIDQLLRLAWQQRFADASDIALLAVGGYGRGELHPQSDIDVLILLASPTKQYDSTISEFITFLWDIGLEVAFTHWSGSIV